jgi:hypothetical protein
VQVKRNTPIDLLLRSYYSGLQSADIMSMYLRYMPFGDDTIAMIEKMIDAKYPYMNNETGKMLDELDLYNHGQQLAKKIMKSRGN